MTDGLPPCTSCGACCATLHDEGTVADLDPRDVVRDKIEAALKAAREFKT